MGGSKLVQRRSSLPAPSVTHASTGRTSVGGTSETYDECNVTGASVTYDCLPGARATRARNSSVTSSVTVIGATTDENESRVSQGFVTGFRV